MLCAIEIAAVSVSVGVLPSRPVAGQAPCRGPLLFSEERQWNGLAGHGRLSGARFLDDDGDRRGYGAGNL